MSAVTTAAEVLRSVGEPASVWHRLADALVELRGRLDALEGQRQAAPFSAIREEISRLREFSRSARGVVDVNAEATASALEKLDERLEALEVLHGAGQRQAAPAAPDTSDLIALAAAVLDEAAGFQAADVQDRELAAVLDVHAQRCRGLYQKLCAAASRSAVRDQRRVSLLDAAATALVGGSPPSDLTEDFVELQDFKNTVAYELGAERNPDLALDALRARLKEWLEYREFLLQVTSALKLSGEHREDATLALDTFKARLEEYQVLHQFLLDVTSALARPELVPGEAAPEEVLVALNSLRCEGESV